MDNKKFFLHSSALTDEIMKHYWSWESCGWWSFFGYKRMAANDVDLLQLKTVEKHCHYLQRGQRYNYFLFQDPLGV